MPGTATLPTPKKSPLPHRNTLGVTAPSLPPSNCHSRSLHPKRQQKHRGPPLSRQLYSCWRAAPPPNPPSQVLLGRSHANPEQVQNRGGAAALAFPLHMPSWALGRGQAAPLTNSAEPPSLRRGAGDFLGHPPAWARTGSVFLSQPA